MSVQNVAGDRARRPRRRHGAGALGLHRRRRPGHQASSATRACREIEERTRKAGGEIVALLKTGSAFYSPASAAIQMAEAYLLDKKDVLPCAASSRASTAQRTSTSACRCVIGAGGVEKIIEIPLTAEEKKAVDVSAEHVAELVGALDKVLAADVGRRENASMNIHEFQGKALLAGYGVPVPRGEVARRPRRPARSRRSLGTAASS